MNKIRRKLIEESLRRIATEVDLLDGVRESEQDYLDNMPESIRNSDVGTKCETFLEELGTLLDGLTDQLTVVEEAAA